MILNMSVHITKYCFLLWYALLHPYCSRLQLALVCATLCLQFFCIWQLKKHAPLGWNHVTDLTIKKNVPFLYLQKLWGCFCSMFGVIIHSHCTGLSDQFCSIWLTEQRVGPVHFRIHPAASISSHISNKHQWPCSTGSHACSCNNIAFTMFDRFVVFLGPWALLHSPSFHSSCLYIYTILHVIF